MNIDNGTPGALDVGDGWAETNVLLRPRDGRQVGRAALSCSILVLGQGRARARAVRRRRRGPGGSLMFYGLLYGPRSRSPSSAAPAATATRAGHSRSALLDEHRTRWTFALAR